MSLLLFDSFEAVVVITDNIPIIIELFDFSIESKLNVPIISIDELFIIRNSDIINTPITIINSNFGILTKETIRNI
jgi:hypothetical protein